MQKSIAASMRKEKGRRAAGRIAPWLVVALALSGCDDVPEVATFEPITDPRRLFASVTLEHRAINLATGAPYDTFRLVAVPRNALGEPLSGLPAPTFESSDTTRVWVTPDGLLQARRATDFERPVYIVAKVVAENNIAHVDTALVHVTADPNPPRIQSLRIRPDSSETIEVMLPAEGSELLFVLSLASGMPWEEVYSLFGIQLMPQILDEGGQVVSAGTATLAVDFRSSNPDALRVTKYGGLDPYRLETVRVTARSMVYGVEVTDSVDVRVVLPTLAGITITEDEHGNLSLNPKELVLGPNPTVLWLNTTGTPVDIVFDRPDAVMDDPGFCSRLGGAYCDRGDIGDLPAHTGNPQDIGDLYTRLLSSARLRRFPEPGVYTYRSPKTGLTGRLVVMDN